MDQPTGTVPAAPGGAGTVRDLDAGAARLLGAVARAPGDWRPLGSLSEALLAAAPGRARLPAAGPEEASAPGAALAASIRAVAQLDMGCEKAAQRAALEAIRRRPDDPLLLHLVVRASLAAGRAMDALRAAERLDRIAPALAVRYDARALIALRLRRWREAETAARRALQIAPLYQGARQSLALALQGQGKQRQAVRSLAPSGASAAGGPPLDASAMLTGMAADERRILYGLVWLSLIFLLVVQLPQVESLEPLTVVSGALLGVGGLLLLSRIALRRRFSPQMRATFWVAMRRDTPWWPLVLLVAIGAGRLAEAAIAALSGGPVLQPTWRLVLVLGVSAIVCGTSGTALVHWLRARR